MDNHVYDEFESYAIALVERIQEELNHPFTYDLSSGGAGEMQSLFIQSPDVPSVAIEVVLVRKDGEVGLKYQTPVKIISFLGKLLDADAYRSVVFDKVEMWISNIIPALKNVGFSLHPYFNGLSNSDRYISFDIYSPRREKIHLLYEKPTQTLTLTGPSDPDDFFGERAKKVSFSLFNDLHGSVDEIVEAIIEFAKTL